MSESVPPRSDIDRFALALDTSRLRANSLYQRTPTRGDRKIQIQLIAALEELGVAEEQLRVQHAALLQALKELEIERERYHSLFDSAPDPYIVTDSHGSFEQANAAAAQMLGVAASELRSQSLGAFLPPQAQSEFRTQLAAIVMKGGTDSWPLEIKGSDGRVIPVEATVSVLRSSDSNQPSLSWFFRDMSARRETEESMHALNRALNARVAQRTRELEMALQGEQAARKEAEAANRIKSELFARLSHEFRTPLHAVSGYLEILLQNIHGGLTTEQRRDVERIHQAQEHLLTLVNMILDFAKLEGGPIELSMAEIPIEETLVAAESMVAPQFAKKNITFTHHRGDPRLTVFADREKLQQIVLNLLANAMKFTPEGGTTDLAWKVETDMLTVRISDTGPGIPADKIEEIFEPFVQLRQIGSLPPGGTGLGLPISRDLARAMGGDVSVESTVGVGSVFTLLLPLRKRSAGTKLSAS